MATMNGIETVLRELKCCVTQDTCEECPLKDRENCQMQAIVHAYYMLLHMKAEADILKTRYDLAVAEREANANAYINQAKEFAEFISKSKRRKHDDQTQL